MLAGLVIAACGGAASTPAATPSAPAATEVATALTGIPRTFGEFPNLQKLQLQENNIRRVKNLERCKALKSINFNNNRLESESLSVFGKLPHLESIDLSSNRLTSLQKLQDCAGLTTLNAAKNQIRRIPEFPALSRLKYLDLSGNPLEKLENIHYMENLTRLILDTGRLNAVEQEIYAEGLKKVKEYCSKLLT